MYSYLSYGVEAWGLASDSHLEKLLILQKKAVRILTGNKYFQVYGEEATPLPHSEPLFKTLEILKFHDIYKINIGKFIFTTLTKDSPEVFWEWFTYSHLIHNHATTSSTIVNRDNYFDVGTVQQSKFLFTRHSHLVNYGAKMIQVYGPTLWNSLPGDLHDSTSLASFKTNLKKYLIDLYNQE